MTTHLYPTGQAFLNGWPTTEIDVSEELAAELLNYEPPVYATEPTGWPPASDASEPVADPAAPALPTFEEAAAAGEATPPESVIPAAESQE